MSNLKFDPAELSSAGSKRISFAQNSAVRSRQFHVARVTLAIWLARSEQQLLITALPV
jgi:hypothetical protein